MKVCFVTTGATAPFTALIESILKPSSLDALLNEGYTHLLVQYGTAKDIYTDRANATQTYLQQGEKTKQLIIDGMDFDPDGLKEQFKLVQQSNGLVISHAGRPSTTFILPRLK
jgi:beta-1,4-N-acetylglucosaminyltransferase